MSKNFMVGVQVHFIIILLTLFLCYIAFGGRASWSTC